MEFNFFDVSTIWKDARKKRVASFVRILAYLIIVASLQWMVLTIIERIYVLTYATITNVLLGLFVLRLISSGKILAAKIIILITGMMYFTIATVFASGYGINNGTAHFGFIAMGLVSYFILHEYKAYRELISLSMLVLFFLFHFGYAPFYPLVVLPPEKVEFINMLSVIINLLI